ncbi:MAG: porphobilinogen synthase [Candidatus Ratteibacteria bacterium]
MKRFRRLRKNEAIRDLVSKINISKNDFVLPFFVKYGKTEEIKNMPKIFRYSIDDLLKEIEEIYKKGLKSIILFGVIDKNNEKFNNEGVCEKAFSEDGIVQKAIRKIKENFPDLIVISDVCLCNYTETGHCGIVKNKGNNYYIDNDKTLEILEKIALSHAFCGVDFVAPSSMMDFQTKAIREVLDKNNFIDVGIISYTCKYASNLYFPFRESVSSNLKFGDRKTYQMDFRNSDEFIIKAKQDIQEGADILMVKPAIPYLDIIYRMKKELHYPLCAYNVSGEYVMVKDYVKRFGEEIEKDIIFEILTSIKRAGADFIISYHAKEILKWI